MTHLNQTIPFTKCVKNTPVTKWWFQRCFNLNPYFKEDVQMLTIIFELGRIFFPEQARKGKDRSPVPSWLSGAFAVNFQGCNNVIEQNPFLESLGRP